MRHSTGIEINLLVGGIRLQEYDRAAVETEPKPVLSSRYVEAVAETNFEVEVCVPRYTAPSCEDSILAIVFLDGKRVAGIHGNLKEGGLSRPIRREGVVRNTLEGGRLAKFAFGKLQTNDDSDTHESSEDFQDLGKIRVDCSWVRTTGKSVLSTNRPACHDNEATIPEKCLKGAAISIQAKLQPGTPHGRPAFTKYATYSYAPTTFASFEFLCRSRRDLQIEGIIERTPEPTLPEEWESGHAAEKDAREVIRDSDGKRTQAAPVKMEKRKRSPSLDNRQSENEEAQFMGSGNGKRSKKSGAAKVIDLEEE